MLYLKKFTERDFQDTAISVRKVSINRYEGRIGKYKERSG